jgi:hypothetical protein
MNMRTVAAAVSAANATALSRSAQVTEESGEIPAVGSGGF